MIVTVNITELTEDEEAGAALCLREMNTTPGGVAQRPDYLSVGEGFAAQISAALAGCAARAHEEKVTALRAAGELLVQLPPDVRTGLVNQLIQAALENGIDVSGFIPPSSPVPGG